MSSSAQVPPEDCGIAGEVLRNYNTDIKIRFEGTTDEDIEVVKIVKIVKIHLKVPKMMTK